MALPASSVQEGMIPSSPTGEEPAIGMTQEPTPNNSSPRVSCSPNVPHEDSTLQEAGSERTNKNLEIHCSTPTFHDKLVSHSECGDEAGQSENESRVPIGGLVVALKVPTSSEKRLDRRERERKKENSF